jgi:hypothetical protein
LLPAEELGGALRVCLGADALEGCMRGIELGDRSVLVAAPAEREREQDASLRSSNGAPTSRHSSRA